MQVDEETSATRFGDIKRGGEFVYRGQVWRRTQGRFALPIRLIGKGYAGFYFDVDTEVGEVGPQEGEQSK